MKKIIFVFLLVLAYDGFIFGENMNVKSRKIAIDSQRISGEQNQLWRGMGMVSGNNSSRLLIDYKSEHPDKYNELLNLMFGENGIGIQHLKIEMGADVNSSSGTEPATMRRGEEKADVTRGAGFILCADAKKINPNLTLDMLWWSEPLWIEKEDGRSDGADLPKEKIYENRYKWYRENLTQAYAKFGLVFDYVSATQNERGWDCEWIKYLSKRLKSDKSAPYDFSKIKIVIGDEVGTWNQANLLLNDEELFNAVDVIGSHYTCWSNSAVTLLRSKGKEVWFSEGSSPMGYAKSISRYDGNGSGLNGLNGVLDIANRIITMYPGGKMTLYEFQPVIASYYDGVTYCHKQLITANTPWSGYYELDPGFFMSLHFSRFIKRGWAMVDDACFGDGKAAGDGHAVGNATYSYITGCNPETGDWSTVITNTTCEPIEYNLVLKNRALTKAEEVKNVFLYETSSWRQKDTLKKSKLKFADGIVKVTVKPNSLITVSTINCNPLEEALSLSTAFSFEDNYVLPLPYQDDFKYTDYPSDFLCERGFAPLYTTDEGGAFEVFQSAEGNVLVQKIGALEKAREWGGTPEPVTNFGDDRWFNYSAEIEVKFSTDSFGSYYSQNYGGIGLRYNLPDSGKNGWWLQLFADGRWILNRNKKGVDSGRLGEDFEPSVWHKIQICAENEKLSGFVDGKEIVSLNSADFAGTNISMQGAGRAAIFSYYEKNQFKNLKLMPLGNKPYIKRIDNLDEGFNYIENKTSKWQHSLMDSFKNYKRTVSKGSKGAVCTLTFNGSSFALGGTTEKSVISVKIDGKLVESQMKINKTSSREILYFVDGLTEKKHKVEIKVLAGEIAIDSAEIR